MTLLLLLAALGCVATAAYLVASDLIAGRARTAAVAQVAAYGGGSLLVATPQDARPRHRLVEPLARLTLRVAPGRTRERTAAQVQAAGFRAGSAETFLAAKSGLALTLAALGLLVGAASGMLFALVLALLGAATGFVLPDIVLTRRASARRERILRDLPNALDLISVIVQAGLGLDAALARFADTAEGPLAQEIGVLVAEMRVGQSRAEVFRAFAERVPAQETQSFVRAVTAADQLGVSLSGTLRSQAREARVRRQMAAEQKANRAPVKMLFPTVLCIFPVLFVIVLAPAFLNIAGAK